MKRYILSAIVAIALPSMVQAESVWSGGVDTDWTRDAQGRYEITTADELAGLAQRVNGGESFSGETFVLTDDINLADYQNWVAIGYVNGMVATGTFEEHRYFSGVFDGQGHTVSHYYLHEVSSSVGATYSKLTAGLFGAISNARICNLVVRDSYLYLKNNHYSNAGGAIVGLSVNSTITGCAAINNRVEVYAPYFMRLGKAYAGGICGVSANAHSEANGFDVNSNSEVTDCVVAGNQIVADGSAWSNSDNPTDIINGTSSDTNNTYSDESAIANDKDAIARKNERVVRENIVNNANPPYCLWDEETGMLTDKAPFNLDTTPEIIGGGVLEVYCPTAVEYTIDGVVYTTITQHDDIHIAGVEYAEPTRLSNGYQMYYYKCYCNGVEVLHQDAMGVIDFDNVFTGATGHVTVQGIFAPNYLVEVETNGVSDAFVFGESSYIARENELVSITLLTDTIYEVNGSYRYYTVESITLNESDVLDMVIPGQISLLEFAMPAMSVMVKVEFEENVYTSVEGTATDAMRIYGVDGALMAVVTEPQSMVVVTPDGRVVYNGTIKGNTHIALPAGVYIANGNKVVVR